MVDQGQRMWRVIVEFKPTNGGRCFRVTRYFLSECLCDGYVAECKAAGRRVLAVSSFENPPRLDRLNKDTG